MDTSTTGATGRRILIVEDEFLVSALVEAAVTDLGYVPVGPVDSLAEAMRLAGSERLTGGILDVNLRGQSVYPVADALKARGIPFVFMTGCRKDDLRPPHNGVPTLEKPFDDAMLTAAIRSLARRSA